MCQVSHIMFFVLRGTCHLSLTQTATATAPPPVNSPTMNSRLAQGDQKVDKILNLNKHQNSNKKKSRMRETLNLSNDADKSTNTYQSCL